jgi:AraC-like DNA-binding protein
MEFVYLNKKDSRGLVRDLFKLSFTKEDLPFETIILPLGFTTITFIFNKQQNTLFKGNENPIKGLTVTGQFYGTYNYFVNDESSNLGIRLEPASLYKILNTDISLFTNKHILFEEINSKLAEKFEPLFTQNKDNLLKFEETIIEFIENLHLTINSDVEAVDKVIDYLIEKDGLLQVNELLNVVPFSQKSLETKFKKIVGLTATKFMRQYRFMNLMQKYQTKEINLKDLLYQYNYYDFSHFYKDFRLFMNQSPKLFFNQDHPLLDKYLREY